MLKKVTCLLKIYSIFFILFTLITISISTDSMKSSKNSEYLTSQVLDNRNSFKTPLFEVKAPNIIVSQIYEINDDEIGSSDGDGDHFVDAGETIELRLQLENNGDQAVTNVYGYLSSINTYVTISSANQSYLEIDIGSTRLSTSYYIIEFNSKFNTSDSISFNLEITTTEGTWYDTFELTIVGVPEPVYYGHIVTNEINGDLNADDDGIIDPGEIITFQLYIENIGESNFFDVDGYLSTTDPFVTVTDPTGYIGTIYGGDFDYGYFAMEISGACSELHNIPLNFSLTDKFSNIWNISFEIIVSGFPIYQISNLTFFEYYGDEDGIMDAGESWSTQLTIQNIGGAIGKNVDVYLGSSEDVVEFYYYDDHNITIGDLQAGFSEFVVSYYYWRFIISDRAAEGQQLQFFISITDDNGLPATIFNTSAQVIGVADYELYDFNIVEYCYYDDDCNGRIDAGDTYIVNISVINIGKTTGNAITVYLYSSDTYIEFYYENGSYYNFGSLDEGDYYWYYGYYYWEFTISEKAKTGQLINFTVVIKDASNREWFFPITITIEHGPTTFFYTARGIAWTVGGTAAFLIFFVYPIIRNKKSKNKGSTLKSQFKKWRDDQKEKRKEKRIQHEKEHSQKQKAKEAVRQEQERERIARINANERQLLEKFENILEMSESVDISLVAKSLGLSESQLFEKLIQWQDVLPFKIDGQFIEVDDSEDFTQSIHEKIAEISKYYSCYNCGFPIERTTKECPDCKSEIILCSVCKLPISFGDDIATCTLCEAKGHLTHMQEWVKTQGKCPICLQKLSLRGLVQSITEDKK
ncbi:MAG TPA: hypothetical protein VMZ29_16450 [Candidatus Bathyarchaeia archaeon]|nr:hypothetical protein [Candidatus Bathyarchaeia archaeon]